MIKAIVNILVLSALTACAQNDVNSGRSSELATDDAVIEALNKESKFEFQKEDVCIVRPPSFPGLILVGFFAHDRGCGGNDCFYRGDKSTVPNVSSSVFKDAGWSDKNKRRDITLNWIREVQTVWETLLTEEPERFNNGFSAPEISLNDDGSITAVYWQQEPSGMLAEANYTKLRLVIDASGNLEPAQTMDTRTIAY